MLSRAANVRRIGGYSTTLMAGAELLLVIVLALCTKLVAEQWTSPAGSKERLQRATLAVAGLA